MTQRIVPHPVRCIHCGTLHSLTTPAGMTLALLSCPNCGSDFDAKKRREMLRQIESIVSGKQNEKPN